MLSLILLENSFQFNEKDYLQTHGTAMGTKMAVAFANIFMAKIEKEILRQSSINTGGDSSNKGCFGRKKNLFRESGDFAGNRETWEIFREI